MQNRDWSTLELPVLLDFGVEQDYKEERFERGIVCKAKLTVPHRGFTEEDGKPGGCVDLRPVLRVYLPGR